MPLTYTVKTVGTPDATDRAMMFNEVAKRNERVTANNIATGATTPLLPNDTNTNTRNSYEIVQQELLLDAQVGYIVEAGTDEAATRLGVTASEFKAMKDSLRAKLAAGVSKTALQNAINNAT